MHIKFVSGIDLVNLFSFTVRDTIKSEQEIFHS